MAAADVADGAGDPFKWAAPSLNVSSPPVCDAENLLGGLGGVSF
jgi:hypothetical protein